MTNPMLLLLLLLLLQLLLLASFRCTGWGPGLSFLNEEALFLQDTHVHDKPDAACFVSMYWQGLGLGLGA